MLTMVVEATTFDGPLTPARHVKDFLEVSSVCVAALGGMISPFPMKRRWGLKEPFIIIH